MSTTFSFSLDSEENQKVNFKEPQEIPKIGVKWPSGQIIKSTEKVSAPWIWGFSTNCEHMEARQNVSLKSRVFLTLKCFSLGIQRQN